jgi:hypothetical protein
MKNVLISLLALAAFSGAALASDVSHDDRGFFQQNDGKYLPKARTATEGLAVTGDNAPLTAFELMQQNAEERNNNAADHYETKL